GFAGPTWKGLFGRLDCRIDFSLATTGDFGHDFVVGRVEAFEGLVALGLFSVDEVFDHGGPAVQTEEGEEVGESARKLTRRPTPSISVTTSSPATTLARPSGVPVRMMSPGESVMMADRYSISQGMLKTMSRVVPRWVSLPLTDVLRTRSIGSGTSAASTSHGPMGVQPSRFFTRRLGR